MNHLWLIIHCSGNFVSEHSRGNFRRRGLIGCGLILILPLIFGLWGTFAALTSNGKGDAKTGLIFSLVLVAISLGLLALYLLLYFMSPIWMKRYKLEIYENGFNLKTPFKTQTCLWSEVREVNPMLLTTPANRARTKPADFQNFADTQYGGIYEVYKKDGSKIIVSRQYTDVARIDNELKRFCKEVLNWQHTNNEN